MISAQREIKSREKKSRTKKREFYYEKKESTKFVNTIQYITPTMKKGGKKILTGFFIIGSNSYHWGRVYCSPRPMSAVGFGLEPIPTYNIQFFSSQSSFSKLIAQ